MTMPKFKVEVSKEWTEHGSVVVDAADVSEARETVLEMLLSGDDSIEWGQLQHGPWVRPCGKCHDSARRKHRGNNSTRMNFIRQYFERRRARLDQEKQAAEESAKERVRKELAENEAAWNAAAARKEMRERANAQFAVDFVRYAHSLTETLYKRREAGAEAWQPAHEKPDTTHSERLH